AVRLAGMGADAVIGERRLGGVLLEQLVLRLIVERAASERLLVALLLRRVLERGALRRHRIQPLLLLTALRNRAIPRIVRLLLVGPHRVVVGLCASGKTLF